MTMAPTAKVVLGSIAFAIFWVMAVFPAVPFLPIGRTAGSLLGAMLMVIFEVLTPDQAYAAIDLPILGLLFGTMVVSVYLERADMFKYLGKLLSWKSRGAKDLLCRICFVSALSSALFTNDTSCVVLTEFVLKLVRQQNLPPHPFLLALASSANIGSSATPIGNPQNLVIAVQSKISFGKFLFGILPSMLVGVVINASILLCMYWKLLSDQKEDEENAKSPEVVKDDEVVSHRFSPATLSHLDLVNSQEIDAGNLESVRSPQYVNGYVNHFPSTLRNRANTGDVENVNTNNPTSLDVNSHHVDVKEGGSRDHVALTESDIQNVHSGSLGSSGRLDASKEDVKSQDFTSPKRSSSIIDYDSILGFAGENLGFSKKWKRLLWKVCVYLVTLGMLISLLAGMDMSWSAITAALALVVLDFKDARPCLEKVSYSLLVFFCGMFITVDGFNKTGIPSTLWDIMEPYAKINRIGGTIVLAVVILVLSNVASNVPTVLLLGARVAASASALSPSSEKKAWLILAWVSTVAGNLSLLGSAANLIVCEQARRAQHCGYNLSFWTHLKFGLPSTLIITAIGLILIRG